VDLGIDYGQQPMHGLISEVLVVLGFILKKDNFPH
jgi:hypothetical protein